MTLQVLEENDVQRVSTSELRIGRSLPLRTETSVMPAVQEDLLRLPLHDKRCPMSADYAFLSISPVSPGWA